MSYTNIASSPEKFGLETVASYDAGEMYDFDEIIVLRDAQTHELFIAQDAGCSCPTPFDGMGRDDLTPVSGPAGVDAYVRSVWGHKDKIDEIVASLVSGVM